MAMCLHLYIPVNVLNIILHKISEAFIPNHRTL